jgi:hypothetical protein
MSSSAKIKPQRPAPFSIRLNAEERAYLERKAGNKPLGAYIRSRLLDDVEARRKPSRAPSMDYALLGQILGVLGKSELASRLCLLAVAAEAGRIALAEEERAALLDACADIRDVRALLVTALGLKARGTP